MAAPIHSQAKSLVFQYRGPARPLSKAHKKADRIGPKLLKEAAKEQVDPKDLEARSLNSMSA
jgi:hypothetical protein